MNEQLMIEDRVSQGGLRVLLLLLNEKLYPRSSDQYLTQSHLRGRTIVAK